jgi:hypothetical protein
MIQSGKHPLASGDLALLNASEPNWAGNAKATKHVLHALQKGPQKLFLKK